MENKRDNCLLIWPPFLAITTLPLGIPFLAAYLKNNGIDKVKVFDMNRAYLKKMRFLHITLTILNRYNNFARRISRILEKIGIINLKNKNLNVKDIKRKSLSITNGTRPSWGKRLIYLHRYINQKMLRLLNHVYIAEKEKQSIPWSLKSMLKLAFEDTDAINRKEIYHVLAPVVKKNKFSLIGISAVYPEQLFFAFIVAKVIKEKFNKDIYVVLGGAQVTKHINYIINSEKVYDFVDFFITDDGEEPLARLLKELPKKNFFDIPNLYFKNPDKANGYEKSKGSFHLHPEDFSVPDFSGFDLDSYQKIIPILVSKGCFWSKCSFCTYASMQGHRYCVNTIENTLKIIKEIKRIYGIFNYRFVDDELQPGFLKELATGLLREKLNINWSAGLALSREFSNQDFCRLLRNTGLHFVTTGLESISVRILHLMDKYHKNMSESEIQEILTSLNNADIKVVANIIFGFPGEKFDEAQQTLSFLIKNRGICKAGINPFCLEENTPVFNNPEKFGITKIHKEDKDSGTRLGCRYEVAEGMSQEEAGKFADQAMKILSIKDVEIT